MGARLLLQKERDEDTFGTVRTVQVYNGSIAYGLSIGTWSTIEDKIFLDLRNDLDTIIHETATSKGVRAELRAAEKDAKGVEIKPTITLDPRTKRFKQVW